jgi:hypothetical protein
MIITTVKCDWCEESPDITDMDELIEKGWLSVHVYDTLEEEEKELDFCSSECLVSHFG